MEPIEIRCPVGPKRLLFKLRLTGLPPIYTDDNLLEIACDDCKRLVRNRGRQVNRVIHAFNFLGELVTTKVE
jgi:DNA-directed RNA polymerase subunit RPC12/RpoP